MTWLLTASGNPPDVRSPEWRSVEERLVEELRAVLSKPEYASVSSWFRGIHVAESNVHKAVVGEVHLAGSAADTVSPKRGPGRPRSVNVEPPG